jgi:hypothetical protein
VHTVAHAAPDAAHAKWFGHAVAVATQAPEVVLHAYVVIVELLQVDVGQVTAVPGLHTPLTQESTPLVPVQALPSLHDRPSAFVGFVQTPVDVLQTPAVWH